MHASVARPNRDKGGSEVGGTRFGCATGACACEFKRLRVSRFYQHNLWYTEQTACIDEVIVLDFFNGLRLPPPAALTSKKLRHELQFLTIFIGPLNLVLNFFQTEEFYLHPRFSI